jgi:hypothetical protein
MKMIVGGSPVVVGKIPAQASEMMFVQYLPVHMPHQGLKVPEHVKCFQGIIDTAMVDFATMADVSNKYVYLTAKHLYVTPENLGNRPGWHIDGFGTEDINYIWYDSSPTEFCNQTFDITDDEHQSIADMTEQADEENVITYPVETLLRLDNMIVHRTTTQRIEPGYRTFVKVSISDEPYNLKGNARNYMFDYDWDMKGRDQERNVTSK